MFIYTSYAVVQQNLFVLAIPDAVPYVKPITSSSTEGQEYLLKKIQSKELII